MLISFMLTFGHLNLVVVVVTLKTLHFGQVLIIVEHIVKLHFSLCMHIKKSIFLPTRYEHEYLNEH